MSITFFQPKVLVRSNSREFEDIFLVKNLKNRYCILLINGAAKSFDEPEYMTP